MALAAAVVIGGTNRRRAPNCRREACISTENMQTSVRLSEIDVQLLANEYRNWRAATRHVNMRLLYSMKRIKVFLQYLAKGGYYRQVGRAEGLAECTAMTYLHDVAVFFQDIAPR